jgi:hypothetical protein
MCYSASNYLCFFCCCFFALWSDRMQDFISNFLYLLSLALCPKIWSIWEKVPWAAENNLNCFVVGWNILQTSVRSLWSMASFSSRISLLSFCLDDLSIGDQGVLKFPTITVLESICVFKSISVCLMKLGALTLGTYRLIIIISFWCISPFISMKCPSLSFLINVSLTSTLSEVSIATLACFQVPLAWWMFFQSFTLSQCLFLSIRWVSCK